MSPDFDWVKWDSLAWASCVALVAWAICWAKVRTGDWPWENKDDEETRDG